MKGDLSVTITLCTNGLILTTIPESKNLYFILWMKTPWYLTHSHIPHEVELGSEPEQLDPGLRLDQGEEKTVPKTVALYNPTSQ